MIIIIIIKIGLQTFYPAGHNETRFCILTGKIAMEPRETKPPEQHIIMTSVFSLLMAIH